MFQNKSIYALNKKDTGAIVYFDAKGTIEHLTRDAFASDEEFLKWKEWSDNDYHVSEKKEHVYANHTLSLEGLSDEAAVVQSSEADLLNKLTNAEYTQNLSALMEQVRAVLSEKQYRRLWMYHIDDMTLDAIACIERVRLQSIAESIKAAEKKVLNISKYFLKTP